MDLRNQLLAVVSLFLLHSLAIAGEFPTEEPLAEDTPAQTVRGNPFTASADWTVSIRGNATIIEAPEGDSQIVYVDVDADDAESAIDAAWAAYKEHDWPLKTVNEIPDSDGWSKQTNFLYQTSPNEKRSVSAAAMFANEKWTVFIYDMADDVRSKRGAQINLMISTLVPSGYERESFAGMKAKRLGDEEIAELAAYIELGLEASGVPGTSVGIIQDGKVVFSGGFGVRELGKTEQVDGDTLYMIASNTKGLTTLLLAKLVDQGKVDWKDKVVDVLPGFKLGNEETTEQVLVEHLVCACTGLPRQDLEALLEFDSYTPESSMDLLATMQPTTGFGELYQYSNVMASAGGYVAGHVMHPEHELGSAYDKAMQSEIFDPLDMSHTTFDYDRAMGQPNYARPHGIDVDGKPAAVSMDMNYVVVPVRPAGAGWSSVNDMLKYVAMELAAGKLPSGERYIGEEPLLERRVPKVPVSEDIHYGMGLILNEFYDVPLVHHGGSLFGYYSDMMWLPDHGVGAVVLTNGVPGWIIRNGFKRKLLEVLFDGKPEADEQLASSSARFLSNAAVEYELLVVPAAKSESEALADRYYNAALGNITVERDGDVTTFDFDEWASEVGSRENPDGTISFVTIAPGIAGLEFVVGDSDEKSLVLRDAQHEYVFSSSIATDASLARDD